MDVKKAISALKRAGYTHLYNNLYSGLLTSGANIRMGGYSLIEGNWFENSQNPVTSRDSPSIGYWQLRGNKRLARCEYLHEAFERHHGALAKSYPARFPMLRLDRVYLRNATSHEPRILGNKPWTHLSDHLPLAVEVHL